MNVGNSPDGRSKHPRFGAWYQMLRRCDDPRHHQFHDYGGRGIRVHDAWRDFWQYVEYLDQELGPRPPGCSLDRADNDGHYEPGNLRWATRSEQNENQRLRRHQVPVGVSGYHGVRRHKKSGRWQARFWVKGSEHSLGYYDTPEEAARAYDRKAVDLLGERAITNFSVSDYVQ